jgi:NADP-dependent 3-hydroxy acid dehydrogenase YdfG
VSAGEKRVAVVTGGANGLGRADAERFVRGGYTVVIADLDGAAAERTAAEIGQGTVGMPVDVRDPAAVESLFARVGAELGRLDALVNNAGVMLLGPILDAPLDEWRQMIHVNLFGVLYCTHPALPIMLAQGSGHVVNVSSVAGRIARAGSGVYNLTKWGVGAFSEALRQEVAAQGIRVTLVEPGAVATELAGHNRPEIQEVIQQNFQGVERLTAEDIADAILYTLGVPQHVSLNEVLIRPTAQVR